jgi:hypothetical protein
MVSAAPSAGLVAPRTDAIAVAAEATSVLFKDLEPLAGVSLADLYTPVTTACAGDQWPHAKMKAVYMVGADGLRRLADGAVKDVADLAGISRCATRFARRGRTVKIVFGFVEEHYAKGGIPGLGACAIREFCRAVVAKFGADRLATATLPPYMASPAVVHMANYIERAGPVVVDGESLGLREVAKKASLFFRKEVLPARPIEECPTDKLSLVCRFAVEVRKRQERIQGLLARWRRLSFKVGKIVLFLTGIFTEVHFRPTNEGFLGCKRSYQDTLEEYEPAAKLARGA